MSADEARVYWEGITGSQLFVGGMEGIMTPRQVSSFMLIVLRLSTMAFRVRRVLMWSWILDLLRMGPPHVGTLFPFILDRVPSLLRCPSCHDPKSSYISTIEGDVPSCKLILKVPFVKTRDRGVNGCGIGCNISSRGGVLIVPSI